MNAADRESIYLFTLQLYTCRSLLYALQAQTHKSSRTSSKLYLQERERAERHKHSHLSWARVKVHTGRMCVCICVSVWVFGFRRCQVLFTDIAVKSIVTVGKVMTGQDCQGHVCVCVSMSSVCVPWSCWFRTGIYWAVTELTCETNTHISYSVLSRRRCLSCSNWFMIRQRATEQIVVLFTDYIGYLIHYCFILLDRVLVVSVQLYVCPSELILLVSMKP